MLVNNTRTLALLSDDLEETGTGEEVKMETHVLYPRFIITVAATGSPEAVDLTAKIQVSHNGVAWTDFASFNSGSAIEAAGEYHISSYYPISGRVRLSSTITSGKILAETTNAEGITTDASVVKAVGV